MLAISSLSEFCGEQGYSEEAKPKKDMLWGPERPQGNEGMRVVGPKMQRRWSRGGGGEFLRAPELLVLCNEKIQFNGP